MTELSPLDRFILSAAVGGMFASLAFFAAQRTAKFWKAPFVRFARTSRPVQALVLAGLVAVTALGGGKTNDPPLRALGDVEPSRVVANPPAWFVSRGYPATDADANGIPDCWEKWTHTAGMADDDDPDGDGLTNYDEFEAQTDPIRADTDGDGIDDATELAGLAAGVADLDPLVPATFAADEPDADRDGVPDLWEGADAILFDGCDTDGFPWDISVPEAATTNYDVRLTVSSSRHAALTWGTDESLLLPPCTNLALRLRLAADDVRTIALSPSPDASTNPVGTWRASLVADWDTSRGLPTEGDRLALPGETMVDRSEHDSVATQAWMPTPALRSGEPLRAGRGARKPSIFFTPRWLTANSGGLFCVVHGPTPSVEVRAFHASPPYIWTERGEETETDGDSYTPYRPYPDGHYEVSVRWKDDHRDLFVSGGIRLDPIQCRPGRTNLVGAAWSSTHNPTNAADHAPGIETHEVSFGPFCPVAHDIDVKLGWTHDENLLNIRNLVRIVSENAGHDRADHSIGVSWSENGSIDLSSFLDETTSLHRERLSFRINGEDSSGSLSLAETLPDVFYPDVYIVDLLLSGSSRPLDTFVLTVFNEKELFEFADWVVKYADTSWAGQLPKPPKHKPDGEMSAWNGPETPGTYMHHDAVFELRSKPVSGGHGHQATYDGGGNLIEDGTIACGTADYVSPESLWDGSKKAHREADVKPYLKALHLDGNPGHPDNGSGLFSETVPSRLTLPCLHQGYYLRQYLNKRPSFPTGVSEQ